MECISCGSELGADASFCPYCGEPTGLAECTDYAFEAFISYRHVPVDMKAAEKLRRALEGFRIPRQLWEKAGKRRLGKCFRDEDELPTSSSLSDQICEALKRSRFLVVVCSPDTAESLWVRREVELFASYHGRERVLVALAAGEPEASFPELLCERLERAEDGSTRTVEVEPLAADFRDLSRKSFNREKLRIVASLIGCGFDDLRQRMRVRRARLASAAAAGVAAVSIAFGGFASYQQAQIAESFRQIQIDDSKLLAQKSGELLAQGDRYQAIQVALSALPGSAGGAERPFVPVAQLALERALQVYPSQERWRSCYSETGIADVASCYSSGGLAASIRADRKAAVTDLPSGDLLCAIDLEEQLGLPRGADGFLMETEMVFAGERLVCKSGEAIGCFDARTGSCLWRTRVADAEWLGDTLAVSADGKLAAAASRVSSDGKVMRVEIIGVDSGEPVRTVKLPGYAKLGFEQGGFGRVCLAFSEDGGRLAVCASSTAFQIDVGSGRFDQASLSYFTPMSATYIDDRLAVVTSKNGIDETGATSLQVFDESLGELWKRACSIDMALDKHGQDYAIRVDVCGLWNFHRDDRRQLVVVAGADLLLLDEDTGREEYRLEADAPWLDCMAAEVGGESYLFLSSYGGDLMYRVPTDESPERGASNDESGISLGWARFVEAGGELFLVGTPMMESRRVVYRFSEVADLASPRSGLAPLVEASRYCTRSNRVAAVSNDGGIALYDAGSFELVRAWDSSDFGLIEQLGDSRKVKVGLSEARLFVAGAKAGEGESRDAATAVYAFDASDGALASRFEVADVDVTSGGLAVVDGGSGSPLLLLNDFHRVVLVDPGAQGAVRGSYTCDSRMVEGAWLCGDSLIVFESKSAISEGGEGESGFAVVELAPGEGPASSEQPASGEGSVSSEQPAPGERSVSSEQPAPGEGSASGEGSVSSEQPAPGEGSASGEGPESDLDGVVPLEGKVDGHVAFSGDLGRIAVVCSDGAVRCFGAQDGSLLWQAGEVPAGIGYIDFDGAGDLWVQDSSGRLVLLSGEDGAVLLASSTTLPPIIGVPWSEGARFAAVYQMPGLNGHTGMAVVQRTGESFDPVSDVFGGRVISEDGSSVVVRDSSDGKAYCFELVSLDELARMALDVTAGHELTDIERDIYQID